MAKDTFQKYHQDELKVAMSGLLVNAQRAGLDVTDVKIANFIKMTAEFNAQQAANMRQLSNIIHRKTK